MDPPLGFMLKLPPAMIVVPIAVKIFYFIGFVLLACACFSSGAWAWYKQNKAKANTEKYHKSMVLYRTFAAIILIILTIVDFLFVSGLPPMWWPDVGGDGNNGNH